jgi:hypothetical protein
LRTLGNIIFIGLELLLLIFEETLMMTEMKARREVLKGYRILQGSKVRIVGKYTG